MEPKKIVLIMAAFLIPSSAMALDASCSPMVSASEARIKQPAWHSVMVVNGNFASSGEFVGAALAQEACLAGSAL